MLEVRDLYVSYGKVAALNGVTLSVPEGSIVSLIGSNGAGKSTFLNALSGLVRIKSGDIKFKGAPLSRLPHVIVGQGLVQVPEGRKIFSGLTVRENLLAGAYLNRNRREVQQALEEVFALFPILKERQKQYGGTLSGGEQQMLAIARGLMARPKLLALDEPSLGLAPLIVRGIFELIKKIRSRGVTILLVEQNANKALEIADYAYVLENGRVICQGSGQELLHDEAVKRAYLGIRGQEGCR
ncbi:High-affinity branched-chain amino acid transport ATP-binding protein LivF [Neomoorella glycerini]|uniref:High-affinity branched-chain amino acid transport ATP-binding protein LivF n=1 Tax=Neomoorella glycerini TaxID=55779 RepID=A0A6I5ZQE1_9FIRM|nr:ABC transporter ATP-binding protein [Moorella glycerini]QGP92050.1 High-affinity branched-chain amino acid transport ATP-binding protein LivF [Moorella glycerini]